VLLVNDKQFLMSVRVRRILSFGAERSPKIELLLIPSIQLKGNGTVGESVLRSENKDSRGPQADLRLVR
jgi:hypothetical protein